MKVEYINPFLEAAISILRQTTQMEVERGVPSLDNGQFNPPEVMVSLGIVGNMQGQVIFGISRETALGIAGKMMGGLRSRNSTKCPKAPSPNWGT